MAKVLPKISDIADSLKGIANPVLTVEEITVPFTAITNRAAIPDLSKIPTPKLGIERITFGRDIELLQDEVGPNGEQIYRIARVKDPLGRIRIVSDGETIDGSSGKFVVIRGSEFLEVVFFGTGLNIINATVSSNLYSVTVDNGTPISVDLTGNTILNGRNYNTNVVGNLVSGLPLGVHTVRIGRDGGNDLSIYGFEILNESAQLAIPQGSVIGGGRKITVPSQTTTPYNSGFTNQYGTAGTKGGRVLVYADGRGQVKKDIQWVDTTQLNLSSADHSNEELVRKIHWREFGAGRADDFSTLSTTASDRAFVLEDGTTSLIGEDVLYDATLDGFLPNTTGDFATIIFVGTGLDLIASTDVNTREVGISINGVSIGTASLAANKTNSLVKIVSGLPYGTHALKISQTGGGGPFRIHDFLIYGPKKPELPKNTVELGDYNLVADFDGTTATGTSVADNIQIPRGVLLKNAAREITYEGTIGSALLFTNRELGWQVDIDNTGVVEYTFFGTGITMHGVGTSSGALIFDVTIDGVANASGVNRGGVTNDGGGQYTLAAGSAEPRRIEFSGLSLGVHTIRMTRQGADPGAAGNLGFVSAFVHTPIHSYSADTNVVHPQLVGSNTTQGLVPIKDAIQKSKLIKRQEKIITTLVSTANTDVVRFSGLVVGRSYRLSGVVSVTGTSATAVCILTIMDGSTIIRKITALSTAAIVTACPIDVELTIQSSSLIMKTDAAWVDGNVNHQSGGFPASWLTLEELPENYIETDEW